MITLIGLGVNSGDISYNALLEIKRCNNVYLRTENTLSKCVLDSENISYKTFDHLFVSSKNFDTLNKKIVSSLLRESQDVCYLVDGAVDEDEVCKKIISKRKNVKIFNGVSRAGHYLSKLGLGGTYTSISAHNMQELTSSIIFPLVIFDIDNVLLCGQLKFILSDLVGENTICYLFNGGKVKKLPLYEIDRQKTFDYSTSLVIPKRELVDKERYNLDDLMEILRILRGENGCPWDKVQTKESILKNLIEECYELVDAIKLDDEDKMLEEIGDNFMQCSFHSLFAEERNAFTLSDIFTGVCTKLISRHTHIFGADSATSGEDALNVWEKNKEVEKNITSVTQNLKDVPSVFPALMRAQKVYKRAYKGLKLTDSKEDILKEISNEKEVGDLLFSLCKLAFITGVDAEECLTNVTENFISEIAKKDNLA